MKQKLAGMTGAAIDDEAGDVDEMNEDAHDEDHDENSEPSSHSNHANPNQ
jgi:hypothetical protein